MKDTKKARKPLIYIQEMKQYKMIQRQMMHVVEGSGMDFNTPKINVLRNSVEKV